MAGTLRRLNSSRFAFSEDSMTFEDQYISSSSLPINELEINSAQIEQHL